MDKKEFLTNAVKAFEGKKVHTPQDYITFIIIARKALEPADGLSWVQVEEAIKDGIYGVGNWSAGVKDNGPHWSDKKMPDVSADPFK